MKLVIHDRGESFNEEILPYFGGKEETSIVGEGEKIKHCIGCFGCWIKTPTECVIKDNYNRIPAIVKETDSVILISECVYGMYSPFVKNILDRSIGYLHPYFTKRNGEMHHRLRYQKKIGLSVYYYGKTTEQERELAKKIAEANTWNLHADLKNICFFDDFEALLEGMTNENCVG